MSLDDFSKILLPAGFLLLGAFLTAVRAKITANKKKNNSHQIFYVVSGIIIGAAILTPFIFWEELWTPTANWLAISAILLCLVAGILLLRFTKLNLVGKSQYRTIELDPVVNTFTKDADKANIRLLAGDLNFFGNTSSDINSNSQYTCLRDEQFHKIQILCTRPRNNQEKIRYGKILMELPVEIKFYQPGQANLNIRGRIKTLANVTRLLMYIKIQSGVYEALELDTANSSGAMYERIWDLVWHLADDLMPTERQEYIDLYSS